MTSKGFLVKIYFDLHSINCPGVWLCPNGSVALRINTLNSHIESRKLSPTFPILFEDKFLFKKTFIEICTLTQLEVCLEDEFLYAELIQWPTIGCKGVILATFETNLMDLLYPATCVKGLMPGVDVDLLMEPSKYFPGILAPKIEVSTRTMIEEIDVCGLDIIGARIINPKMINSKGRPCIHRQKPAVGGIIRQKQVCHRQGIPKAPMTRCTHRFRYCTEEAFGKNSNKKRIDPHIDQCYQKARKGAKSCSSLNCEKIDKINYSEQRLHDFYDCPVCLRYSKYFSINSLNRDLLDGKSNSESRKEVIHDICDATNCTNHKLLDNKSQSSSLSSLLSLMLERRIRNRQKS